MNDNEVIKALEWHLNDDEIDCGSCPYSKSSTALHCVQNLIRDAYALINRKNAEVERLNIRNKALMAITQNYDWKFEKAKSEAIKEFAERLKKEALKHKIFPLDSCVDFDDIDNLAKEMVGE